MGNRIFIQIPYLPRTELNLCNLGSSNRHLHLDIHTTKEPNEVAYKPSAAGLGIQKTPTEVAHRPWAASLRLQKHHLR